MPSQEGGGGGALFLLRVIAGLVIYPLRNIFGRVRFKCHMMDPRNVPGKMHLLCSRCNSNG